MYKRGGGVWQLGKSCSHPTHARKATCMYMLQCVDLALILPTCFTTVYGVCILVLRSML